MLDDYNQHLKARAETGIPAKPLTAEQTDAVIHRLINDASAPHPLLIDLLTHSVPPGVDPAAKLKAAFLFKVALQEYQINGLSPEKATMLLGSMQGGYNVQPLIELLDHSSLAPLAAEQLSSTILIFEKFSQVEAKAKNGNVRAKEVLQSWANAEWFTRRPAMPEKITLKVFKVPGETNTDDLSPAPEAWSRPDIPLHALSMLSNAREGVEPDEPGVRGPLRQLSELKSAGWPLVYVGDVVGTGSSRKSATNSILWHIGNDIPYVPNKRNGGFVFGGKIAPIFFNTLEDSGALPVEMDVSALTTGMLIDLYPYKGEIRETESQRLVTTFTLKTDVLLDEVRAGGRIPLIIGRSLTAKARESLKLKPSEVFRKPASPAPSATGFTLAQKMVGKACGVAGIRPGQYCEPKITTVGSQDTTGGMTRDELTDLACLTFSADLVMQSFCHTSAYPKPVDVQLHETLPQFITSRKGVALKPGDGIIHSWLNRMLLPDTVGTGADSHTRFPLGISFPGGSGLVAFAAATGIMPLDMPESVLVRFKGEMQKGITLRDLVHAIPLYARKQGLLTVEKKNKRNIFSGRILEIEGLNRLSAEQAFELADASAERSAAACVMRLSEESVIQYLRSNAALLRWMVKHGYENAATLERRIAEIEAWLANPSLLSADPDAEYAAVIEIDLNEIIEPVVCAPDDPDDARLLSEVADTPIEEVFIGSCMTNIGHFRAAGKIMAGASENQARLWLAPPTKMDAQQLSREGYFSQFIKSGARIEPAGCSLCMGNQARVQEGSHVVSTSTRNFPHRLGTNAKVFLASAELSTVAAILGRMPTVEEYFSYTAKLHDANENIYRYLSFDTLTEYTTEEDDNIQVVNL
ncbi:bifunctional aconitate hydratase 2/2-methylisocitrate dehydratase [Enterobacter sp. A11]|uniref:bifunctional aconitate hydratase 2/2-methylisocitrate dehydratase n=1 Tax=unclassified Enterobacter TaxID=2608935 RepID=UPI00106F3B38|nr:MULTISPECIES: bifunctional aconitate hydratase 2/2-methylisocitrate dehydratase [unclassified Enterobacter]MBM1022103.1 bifunctional aconitate hydratase 2/2-methylisocitrate dehydratase [Enterobacter sp. E1]MEA3563415.1 bifunctional aconitate hydratase 2/2-methylisocitrate dehydratase [Enterobacter sp. GM-22]MEA3596822.1 bifunctional aconitate hydratase 2/2-methylisocitrate dehydratase [Enterobacter sp. GM-31]TFF57152.1 bifunctional aconitate hydratase 2/2-methylisocitrate dehydratase [Enter